MFFRDSKMYMTFMMNYEYIDLFQNLLHFTQQLRKICNEEDVYFQTLRLKAESLNYIVQFRDVIMVGRYFLKINHPKVQSFHEIDHQPLLTTRPSPIQGCNQWMVPG